MKRLSGWSRCPLFLKFPILVYLQSENYENESEKTWSQDLPTWKTCQAFSQPLCCDFEVVVLLAQESVREPAELRKNVFVPCFTFVAPFMASCNRANPSTGLGRLGSLSAILVKLVGSFLLRVDVMLRRLAAKPLNGFGFLVTNFPFLGIGVVNTGTWKKG